VGFVKKNYKFVDKKSREREGDNHVKIYKEVMFLSKRIVSVVQTQIRWFCCDDM